MPCRSMTGFARAESTQGDVKVLVEMRAVNHRFSEINVRLPRDCLGLEEEVRAAVSLHVARGRCDVFISIEPTAHAKRSVNVDWTLLDALIRTDREVHLRYATMQKCDGSGQGEQVANLTHWLTFPDVIRVESSSLEEESVREAVLQTVKDACTLLVEMRTREGSRLAADFERKLNELNAVALRIERRAPAVQAAHRERLLLRIAELAGQVDESRLLMEVALLAERSAIDEELVRLRSHIEEFSNALATGSPIGRRLDFIVQEMHREVNTIGSKSLDMEIAQAVVDAKVIVEQLREQVQNIE